MECSLKIPPSTSVLKGFFMARIASAHEPGSVSYRLANSLIALSRFVDVALIMRTEDGHTA